MQFYKTKITVYLQTVAMTLAMLIEEKNVEIVFINQKSVPNQKNEWNFLTVGMYIYRQGILFFS